MSSYSIIDIFQDSLSTSAMTLDSPVSMNGYKSAKISNPNTFLKVTNVHFTECAIQKDSECTIPITLSADTDLFWKPIVEYLANLIYQQRKKWFSEGIASIIRQQDIIQMFEYPMSNRKQILRFSTSALSCYDENKVPIEPPFFTFQTPFSSVVLLCFTELHYENECFSIPVTLLQCLLVDTPPVVPVPDVIPDPPVVPAPVIPDPPAADLCSSLAPPPPVDPFDFFSSEPPPPAVSSLTESDIPSFLIQQEEEEQPPTLSLMDVWKENLDQNIEETPEQRVKRKYKELQTQCKSTTRQLLTLRKELLNLKRSHDCIVDWLSSDDDDCSSQEC